MPSGASTEAGLDPRVERSRRVVLEAALRELADVGFGRFTIESVAGRARVAKSTVYRLWGGKPALIMDALETLNRQPAPEETGGHARERVERLVTHLAEVLADSVFSACLPALIDAAERDPDIRDLHHRFSARRRRALVDTIAEGVASGEFRADLDPELASRALAGALFYGRLMTREPFDPSRVPELVRGVLDARPHP